MIYIRLLLFIFLFSCSEKTNTSFNQLYESFEIWYFKNHPVLSTYKNYKKYDNFYRKNDFKNNENYLLDLKRFYFELTQINYKKLSNDDKVNYDRIKKTLLKHIYINEDLKEHEWKPSVKLIEIYNGIKYLLYYNSGTGLEPLKDRLSQIEEVLDQSLVNLSYISEIEYNYCQSIINSMIRVLDNIQFDLDYQNENYNDIIDISILVKNKLIQYSNNLKSIMEQFKGNSNNNIFDDKHFKIITESDYSINDTYSFAKDMLTSNHINIFNNTIKIYLEKNDEPIWVDYDDTLYVIQSVIDKIEYNNKINNFKYVEESFNEFNNSYYLTPKFSYYINSYDFFFLDEDLDMIIPPKNSSSNFQINLPAVDISEVYKMKKDNISFNKIQMDLLNAYKLYPGSGYIFNISLNSENLTYKIPNLATLRGLQRYSERIFIRTNKTATIEHQIIHEKNIMRDICACILDIEYNVNNISDSYMLDFLNKNCFLNNFESLKIVNKIKNNHFGYSSINFIGYRKIIEIENKYLNNTNNDYINFYNKILQNGIVDLENLSIPFE